MPRDTPAAPAPSVYNIANLLTLVRLVLVPVFIWCFVVSDYSDVPWRIAATLVFIAAAVTDVVDGWLARRNELVTGFGKIADPIADKALVGAALVLLSLWGELTWWVTCAVLIREIGITVMRFWVIRRGIIAASHGGKIKTVLQVVAISWYVWPLGASPLAALAPWVMGAATAATVISGIDYVVRVIVLRRKGQVAGE